MADSSHKNSSHPGRGPSEGKPDDASGGTPRPQPFRQRTTDLTARHGTIASVFDPRRNSLNAIRLVLAGIVVVFHTWTLGGYGSVPILGSRDVAAGAVAGFFAISGYLITASRVSSRNVAEYFWRRFLRIYPALILSLLLVALLIAPLSVGLTTNNTYDWGSAFGYVLRNALVQVRQAGIDGTLTHNPFGPAWNGSAWTLLYEVLCYLGIGVLVSVVPRRMRAGVTIAVFLLCTGIGLLLQFDGLQVHYLVHNMSRLGAYFAAGAVMFFYRHWIPLNGRWATVATVLLVALSVFEVFRVLAPLPVAYLVLYLGARLPLTRVGAKNDFSYGLYIFAFPVQQLLVAVFPDRQLPVLLLLLLAFALTVPLAVGSWFAVEKPAMALKYLFRPRVRAPSNL